MEPNRVGSGPGSAPTGRVSGAPRRPGPAADDSTKARPRGSDSLQLSDDARRELEKLKAIDRQVRAHEAAHQAAGAGLTGGATFTYRKGPDGQLYAVGGEVSIDTGAVPGNPRATIAKMQQVQAAALAPADPSAQDRAVAAQAAAEAAQAQIELARSGQGQPPGKAADKGLDLSA